MILLPNTLSALNSTITNCYCWYACQANSCSHLTQNLIWPLTHCYRLIAYKVLCLTAIGLWCTLLNWSTKDFLLGTMKIRMIQLYCLCFSCTGGVSGPQLSANASAEQQYHHPLSQLLTDAPLWPILSRWTSGEDKLSRFPGRPWNLPTQPHEISLVTCHHRPKGRWVTSTTFITWNEIFKIKKLPAWQHQFCPLKIAASSAIMSQLTYGMLHSYAQCYEVCLQ